jgi:hypothetical protein
MKHAFIRMAVAATFAMGAVTLRAVPAAADGTIFAFLFLKNETPCTIMIPSGGASVSGVWAQPSDNNDPVESNPDLVTTGNGMPVVPLGAGQTMLWGSASNGGFDPSGTGGSLSIPVGSATINLSWSVPWSYFNGLGGSADGPASVDNGGGFPSPFGINLQGAFACSAQGVPQSCTFWWGITRNDNNPACQVQTTSGALTADQSLSAGAWPLDHVTSTDGRFTLQMQTDGNLVLVDYSVNPPAPLWSTNTWGTSASLAYFQSDGNFAVLDVNGNFLWTSNTGGNPGADLFVLNDGNMEIAIDAQEQGWIPIWSTNTGGH